MAAARLGSFPVCGHLLLHNGCEACCHIQGQISPPPFRRAIDERLVKTRHIPTSILHPRHDVSLACGPRSASGLCRVSSSGTVSSLVCTTRPPGSGRSMGKSHSTMSKPDHIPIVPVWRTCWCDGRWQPVKVKIIRYVMVSAGQPEQEVRIR